MSNFRNFDRDTGFLLPPSVDEWLPEKHLARFVAEVIDSLDLSAISNSYRGSGSASYHPKLLLGVLVYGHATGVFSSRKLERATYDSVAFRFIAANDHPDHDTIAAFRRRFLKNIETLFVQVLLLAREMGMLQLGVVALDGTKVHANASRHSALSYEYAGKIEAQLKAEVAELMAEAEAADQADAPDGMSIPGELRPTDQINLTDEESRIMPVSGGGFEQCYNAQAVVATGSLLVIASTVVQAPNDKQQAEPMLAKIAALPQGLGKAVTLPAQTFPRALTASLTSTAGSPERRSPIFVGTSSFVIRSAALITSRTEKPRPFPRLYAAEGVPFSKACSALTCAFARSET